jgi:Icc-related predicted phosphoesterase
VILVADVHGAFDELARVAATGQPLLVLGDLLNFIDHRTHEGMLADVVGRGMVAHLAELRSRGDREAARVVWESLRAERGAQIQDRLDALTETGYRAMGAALVGAEAYVTYGNVDRPDRLAANLPHGSRFVDGEVVDIEGWKVGFAGGGVPALGVPGEVAEEDMRRKLAGLGRVDVLCTHVAPAVPPLRDDVIGGRPKHSRAVLDYLLEHRPPWHYFGDIHQPQATQWRVGVTVCRNVGYFRATGRGLVHQPAP